MALERDGTSKKLTPAEGTGRTRRLGGLRSGAVPRPGAGKSVDPKGETGETEPAGPLVEDDNASPGDEEGKEKTGRSSGLLAPAKGKKKKSRKAEEAPLLEMEPITEFPRGFSIGVKFAGLSAVVVAFFMAFLGYLTYSITLREVDEQITQKGVAAARALEKGLERGFWVKDEWIKEAIANGGYKEKKDITDPEVNAVWTTYKQFLQKSWNKSLTDLVNSSRDLILATAVIEFTSRDNPTGRALYPERVEHSPLKPMGLYPPGVKPDSPDRVEVFEAYMKGGQRVRRFDKPIVGPDGSQISGPDGGAWVSIFVNAQAIDDVKDQVWQRIMLVTAIGALAGILLTVLIAAFLTRPIRELERDIAVVAEGDLDHETLPSSRDEIGALAHTFNIMTRNLKVAQSNAANQMALERELSIATEIQTKLLPERLPQIPGLDIHSFYLSAKEVGGDYYDFIVIDQTHLGIIVADVSGKGIPGSMVMTMARSLVRLASVRNVSPADTFKKVNRILAKDIRRGMFVTSIYMVLNVKTHELKVASAGHNPLVVFRAASGEIELVKPQGIALGFDKGTIFDNNIQETTVKLEPGDRIVAYTDGVNEAMDAESEEFGDERFHGVVKEHARLNSKDFVNKLVAALEEHRGSAEQSDDITITTLAVAK